MPAPDFLTWDGDVANGIAPYRPGTEDFGGDHFEDDGEAPPDPNEFPNADAWNQLARQGAAQGKVADAAKLEVRFDGGGVPFVARCTGPAVAVVPALFTVTDEGNGVTLIEWPADTFPPAQISPSGLTFISTTRVIGSVEEVTDGIRVRTWELDASGNATAANVPWTINLN